MSCGQLHEPGQGLGLGTHGSEDQHHDGHPAGHAHESSVVYEYGEAGPRDDDLQDRPAGEERGEDTQTPQTPQKPSPVRTALAGAWTRWGYTVRPVAVLPALDGAGLLAHQITAGNPLAGLLTAAAGGAAAQVATEIRNSRRKHSPEWRFMTRCEVAAGTLWALIATPWTPVGPADIIQWAVWGGGAVFAGHHVYQEHKARHGRRKPRPQLWGPQPVAELPAAPPPPDPRLAAFTGRFCQPGKELEGVTAGGFRELEDGFLIEVDFPPDSRHTMADVEGLRPYIAKLYGPEYGVTRDDVHVGYIPERRHEGCCQVVIRPPRAGAGSGGGTGSKKIRADRWDGTSTWDPATGLIRIGKFIDGKPAHYILNVPGSGAGAGMLAGSTGSGKTGTVHIITAEAGLAMLCSRCGARGDCGQCDPQRVMGVWVGDPQEQPMAVWRGRADLTGWGPEGTVELLQFAEQAAAARSKILAGREWWDIGPDGRQRLNKGQGWFDPEVGFPLYLLVVDEWPVLVNHADKELREEARRILKIAFTRWRKVGIHPLFGSQMLDTSQIGDRELREMAKFWNSLSHRADQGSSDMGGILGDPTRLPADEPGAGYINSHDRRSDIQFNTKYAPEIAKPGEGGTDIRHLAGIIETTHLQNDPGTLSVMAEWGIRERMVFTEWRGRPQEDNFFGIPGPVSPSAAGAGPGVGGVAFREDAEKVLSALEKRSGPAGISDLVQETGLSEGAVATALDALAANGQAERAGDSTYVAA